jgi:SAM-dependent methyltransferase
MDSIRPQWIAVSRCPACDASARRACGAIPERYYVFGGENVPTPWGGIQLNECANCGLAYKTPVPHPAFLAGIFERQMGTKWLAPHDYAAEVADLRRLSARGAFDLIDVGAAGGDLLAACAATGVAGLRSALDMVRYPGLERSLNGEFIEGFLDDPTLSWSGRRYDVVTAFDVFEHLHRPREAFANLRALLKPGGLALIETGDSESAWPGRFGIRRWWYARLIEHHIFWSERSLRHCSVEHGFEILEWRTVRHKSRRHLRPGEIARDLLKAALYRIAPDSYAGLAALLGKEGNQPCSPFARDHFRACLRRI